MPAIKGEKTLIELSQEVDVHPSQIKQWCDQLQPPTGFIAATGPGVILSPVERQVSLHLLDLPVMHAASSSAGFHARYGRSP